MNYQNMIPYLLVLIAGIIVPPAVALNSALGRNLKSPLLAALVVMIIGGVFVGFLAAVTRQGTPTSEELAKIPWVVWFGGILISIYMILMNYNVPKVGVGLATCIVIGGQIVAGLVIDHFGLFNLPQASMSLGRLAGFVAIITGVLLVKFF